MPQYAKQTSVSERKSRQEIEDTLARYGATGFMYGTTIRKAMVAFEISNRQVKIFLPMPDPESQEFRCSPKRRTLRSKDQAEAAYQQAVRQRWRALALMIKAKLEAVESGITVFDEEFLAHIVLPDGQTVGQSVLPRIESAYKTGDMPALLEDHSA